MMRHTSLLPIALACILCTACGGLQAGPPLTRFYTLEYVPPALVKTERLKASLRIERFQSAPIYATDRIVYRESAYQRQTYTYHRWRASPSDLVSFSLVRDLRHSARFAAVVGYDSRLSTTHAVEGEVEEFFEEDAPDRWHAVMALNVTLLREDEPDPGRRVVFQRVYRAREPCSDKTPSAVAAVMSAAMGRISATLSEDIYAALADET